MGGTLGPVRHRGAVREIEHNFGSDPAAAHAVVEHAPAVLLCPLDVTVRMQPSDADRRRLVDAAPRLGPMFTDWIARQRASGVAEDDAVVRLHDPLAFLALVGERVVELARRMVVVDDDGRIHEDESRGRAVEVVTDVDVAPAIDRIIALVAQARRTAR
jgi:inosine-uridine nucleoside N-ribohydrolase